MDTPTKTVFFAGLACFSGLFVWLLSLDARSARLERATPVFPTSPSERGWSES